MSVQEYLDKHMLSRKIEDAVNAAVRSKTPDPVLFISNHMKKAVPSVITKVKARQILDSRGIPTVEVDLFTNKGMFRASVPSGDSTGMYEAVELRDGDKGTYLGHAVTKAVRNINEKISEALVGMDPTVQLQIDQAMIDLDKTEKKSELGANAILAVSIAACKAGAAEKEVPLYKHIADLSGKTSSILPVPAFTVISGGKLAGNSLPIQDIMILPTGAGRFEEALQMGSETYHHLKAVITEKFGVNECNVDEDGGFTPNISSVREGLDIVQEAIGRTGYNDRIKIGIDVAATNFCIGTKYDLEFKSPNRSGQNFKSGDDMVQMYKELCLDYPIASIEDPFDKEDWEHSKRFCSLGLCQVVGDDLLMSNPKRIKRAIHESACNSLLLKINQIGTVTEAVEVVKMAKEANWGVVVSHGCGETDDSFIADLAVALGAGQIKAGAPCRGERLAKYNQLLRIEEELGDQAVYAGEDWRIRDQDQLAMYRKKAEDAASLPYTGEYYAQKIPEQASPVNMPVTFQQHVPATAGFWSDKPISAGGFPAAVTTTPAPPPPAEHPVYMIRAPGSAPATIYHAPQPVPAPAAAPPQMVRPVSGQAGQGYYANIQRMPPEVYREQPVYNMMAQPPPTQHSPISAMPQQVVRPPSGGVTDTAYAHVAAYDRQVYYTSPGGVMVPPQYQGVGVAVSGEMRGGGGEAKAVNKVSQGSV